jgi:hypothetical protein
MALRAFSSDRSEASFSFYWTCPFFYAWYRLGVRRHVAAFRAASRGRTPKCLVEPKPGNRNVFSVFAALTPSSRAWDASAARSGTSRQPVFRRFSRSLSHESPFHGIPFTRDRPVKPNRIHAFAFPDRAACTFGIHPGMSIFCGHLSRHSPHCTHADALPGSGKKWA